MSDREILLCTQIVEARIVTDSRTGGSRGFGFVTFKRAEVRA